MKKVVTFPSVSLFRMKTVLPTASTSSTRGGAGNWEAKVLALAQKFSHVNWTTIQQFNVLMIRPLLVILFLIKWPDLTVLQEVTEPKTTFVKKFTKLAVAKVRMTT